MAPSVRRPPAAAVTASLRRSARLAALQRRLAASPAVVQSAPAAPPRAPQRRRRRPFLPLRRSHDQGCLTRDVARHQVVFVHAWSGTGKSSQIPRVLHAAGHGHVICSQLYRLAAESAATQAAADMRAGEVGCLVALYDDDDDDRASAAGSGTAVTYTTHHVLLRMLAGDPILARYGAVVVDEAADGILLTAAVLSCVKVAAARRPDLRVIICTHGAGRDEAAVHGLFPDAEHLCFLTKIGLCYSTLLPEPVTDHVAAAVQTVCRIHAAEPPGDVLVFLPSRADIEAAGRLLAARAIPGIVARCLHDGVPVHLIGDVLESAPDGERKVVLATHIADSAVFVEGIKYIVDSGYRCTDNEPPSLLARPPSSPARMDWALKASVRSGYHLKRWESRGKCFCLYTADQQRQMLGCSALQTRTDDVDCLAGIVLLLKDLGIASGNVNARSFDFEFMLPPRPEKLQLALIALVVAGAMRLDGKVTSEGRRIAREVLGRCYF